MMYNGLSNPLQNYDLDYCGCDNYISRPIQSCPRCCGTGTLYYTERGAIITKSTYDRLPEDERFEDYCPNCDNGEIETATPEPEWFD